MGNTAAESVIDKPNCDVSPKPFTYGLKVGALTRAETLAQSMGAIAPTATPAVLIPLVFGFAGNATWLVYIFATIGIVLVGLSINQFARQSASPGSLYSYSAIGLGPAWGMLTGWSLLLAYVVVISAVAVQFAIYMNAVLKSVTSYETAPISLLALCTIVAALICYKDIKLSAVFMLILELLSMSLILVLIAVTLAHHRFAVDMSQLKLIGVNSSHCCMGLVLAIFGFTGFESAAALGSEAKSPLKAIPQAVILSGLVAGLFYTMSAYAMVLGFSNSSLPLNKCSIPLFVLAQYNGVPTLGLIINIGAAISFFACTVACINSGARIFFLMGHHGIFHASVSKAHSNNQTPHIAVLITSLLGVLPAIVLLGLHYSLMDIVGLTGTISSYGFIISYILVSLAAPAYLYKHHELKFMDVVLALASALIMVLALVGNISPAAPQPYNLLPFVFVAYMIVGIVWYFILKTNAPATIAVMEKDLVDIRNRFEQQAAQADSNSTSC